ncbi:MAG: hypothetical protein ACKO7B_08935 [Flavobacteriales bacterium]
MKKSFLILSFLVTLFTVGVDQASGQCAMCRRNVETNQTANRSKVGTGLNKGILYLMSVPYVIGIVGVAMWMKRRKEQAR